MDHQCKCGVCGKVIAKRATKSLVVQYSERDRELASLLYDKVKVNFLFITKNATEKDFIELKKLHHLDGRDYEVIEAVILWSQQDPFWSKNIRSVGKLRKQFDTLMVQAYSDIKVNSNRVVAI